MCQCSLHIETSQLICRANQLTGFYVRGTLALNELTKICIEVGLFSEAYSAPCQTSKKELFAKIDDSLNPLTLFAKRSILDVCQGSASDSDSYLTFRKFSCLQCSFTCTKIKEHSSSLVRLSSRLISNVFCKELTVLFALTFNGT